MTAATAEEPPADPRLAELALLIAKAADGRQPPVERWHPEATEDIGLRITADGLWHYRDSPINRPALVKLFASILRREADGKHYLVTPVEKVVVTVEDAPLLAVEMWAEGEGREQALSFRTNLDDLVLCGASQPMRFRSHPVTHAPKPYLAVRHGLEALATRAVYLELVGLGVVEALGDGRWFGVWSRGELFAMSPAEAVE
jgi:hypothetical protein